MPKNNDESFCPALIRRLTHYSPEPAATPDRTTSEVVEPFALLIVSPQKGFARDMHDRRCANCRTPQVLASNLTNADQ